MFFYAKLVINLIACNYFFGIVTYGCNCDNDHSIFTKLCRGSGIIPDYVNAIIMVDNWLPGFDMDRHFPLKHVTSLPSLMPA